MTVLKTLLSALISIGGVGILLCQYLSYVQLSPSHSDLHYTSDNVAGESDSPGILELRASMRRFGLNDALFDLEVSNSTTE